MYYPDTGLYKRARRDGVIPADYVDRVLLRRNTVRKHAEDFDNDTLVIALFNIAIRKSRFSRPAGALLVFLSLRPVFRLFTRLDIVRKGSSLKRVPLMNWIMGKLQKEGLW